MKYNLIISFGCSFTQGGGIDGEDFHSYINSGMTRYEDRQQYAWDHSYTGYLSRLLGCDYLNYGTSCASNEFIFKKVYDTFANYTDNKKILVIIQSSILSRILLNVVDSGESVNINGFEAAKSSEQKKYYEFYVTKFFDKQKEYNKVLQQFDVYTTWLKSKNINVVCIMHDAENFKIPKKDYIIDFDKMSIEQFVSLNKLRLSDLPNFPVNDTHYSPAGNEIIANKIYQKII